MNLRMHMTQCNACLQVSTDWDLSFLPSILYILSQTAHLYGIWTHSHKKLLKRKIWHESPAENYYIFLANGSKIAHIVLTKSHSLSFYLLKDVWYLRVNGSELRRNGNTEHVSFSNFSFQIDDVINILAEHFTLKYCMSLIFKQFVIKW